MILIIELILLLLILCLIRVPVPFALGISSVILIFQMGVDLQQTVLQMYKGIGLFPLLAIPFFLLAGNLLSHAGVTEKLIKVAESIVGRFRGGLAHVNVLVSMIFGGISGSSTADVAATGSILIPAMKKAKYPGAFAAAITAASGTMGNIIPPSIYMIIYGSLAGVSIEKLFMAGIIPGILVGLTQMIYSYYYSRKHMIPLTEKVQVKQVRSDFFDSIPALLLVIVVIGGIVGGLFTSTEASVVAVVYTLFLALLYYRTVKFKELPGIFISTAKGYSAILFTIGNASIFGWIIAYLNGPAMVGKWLESVTTNPTLILFIVSGILLITGTFLSETATIIIFMPIFLKMQEIGNIDPIHMGMVVVLMLCLGLVTPPVGINLLIATDVAKERFSVVVRTALPLIFIFLLVVLVIILFPEIVLLIPNLTS